MIVCINYFCKTNIVRINLTFYTPPIPKIILLFVSLLFFRLLYFLTELLMVTYISLLSLLNICYYDCQCLLDKIFKYVHVLTSFDFNFLPAHLDWQSLFFLIHLLYIDSNTYFLHFHTSNLLISYKFHALLLFQLWCCLFVWLLVT